MDEPTSALDPISTMKIEDLMADLREKYTVVIVTHNMQQAARISDDLAFSLWEKWWNSAIRSRSFPIRRISAQRIISADGSADPDRPYPFFSFPA